MGFNSPEDYSVVPLGKWMGKPLHVFDVIESTNDAAMKYAEQGAQEGTVVIADAQTMGRGRQGKVWYAPAGKGLWFSVVLRPKCAPSVAPELTVVAGEAVRDAVLAVTKISLTIKPPNDLLWSGKKVCGILTESSVKGDRLEHVVVGVGVNVNMTEEDFPQDLKGFAGSLQMAVGQPVSRASLLGVILKTLEQHYENWQNTPLPPLPHKGGG